MVAKRIRSEYMKKFKDPKWDTYTKCYEEMLKYRLTRRLLEHTHNPWFWSGSDTDSDSGGRSPPIPPSKNQVRDQEDTGGRAEAELEDNRGNNTSGLFGEFLFHVGGALARLLFLFIERDSEGPRPQQSKPSKSLRQPRRSQRVRPAPSRLPREDSKESRHPFALYGSGEKDADTAGRKTHNVGPVASTNEIHESALRAKTRREVEHQIQTQRSERRRAKSADLDKARKVVQPEFNPWLTEYMRCFSARSR
uniref:Centriole, cilia and spindle-associated protein b n=1 Tax=Neolamprologus brichardi TaxID=32507 RepID=A0A3Q4M9S0_NEOBR